MSSKGNIGKLVLEAAELEGGQVVCGLGQAWVSGHPSRVLKCLTDPFGETVRWLRLLKKVREVFPFKGQHGNLLGLYV